MADILDGAARPGAPADVAIAAAALHSAPMNRLSEFLSQYIGIELWMASLVAIAIVTVAANQVAQVLLRHAAKR